MKIRLKSLLLTIVVAFASYFTRVLTVSRPLSQGVLIIMSIAVATYLLSEHLIPKIERRCSGQSLFKVEGLWWEIQSFHPHIAVASATIQYDSATERISLDGIAYDGDGTESAFFRSVASVFLPERNEIFYQWEGNLRSEPASIMKGVGNMAFYRARKGKTIEGFGSYVEFATPNRPMVLIHLSLVRFTKEEQDAWELGDAGVRKEVAKMRIALHQNQAAATAK